MDYSTKHVEPLISEDDVISNVGTHTSQWRLLRKRYSIRVEFEQAGSLGEYIQPFYTCTLSGGWYTQCVWSNNNATANCFPGCPYAEWCITLLSGISNSYLYTLFMLDKVYAMIVGHPFRSIS